MRIILAALALTLMLAGCGQKRDLKPVAGRQLPPAPRGRGAPRTAAELLQPPVQAAPDRSLELETRSKERKDDPFDLPPSD